MQFHTVAVEEGAEGTGAAEEGAEGTVAVEAVAVGRGRRGGHIT